MAINDNLNAEILKITMVIKAEFPELLKYLTEIPNTIPNDKHPEIDAAALQEYYNSLYNILLKYAPNHSCLIRK